MNTKNQGQEIVWKKEFKTLLGLDGDITDDVDSPTFLDDFKEVNKILKELNDEVKIFFFIYNLFIGSNFETKKRSREKKFR